MTKDRIGALFFLVLSLAYGLEAQQIRLLPFATGEVFTPRTMPTALAIVGGVIAFLMLVLPAKDRPKKIGEGAFAGWGDFAWAKVLALGVLMAIYAYLLTRAGFIVATSLFLVGGFLVLGERRWLVLLGASVPVVVAFWFILSQLLGIYLTPGSWWAALGGGG